MRHRRHRRQDAGRAQIVEALKRLEYRGYDSAGVATLEDGRLERRRAEGKLRNLEAQARRRRRCPALIGIGHTRWATHGKPNETNAHPHATDKLAVVHNGIIENFRELQDRARGRGRALRDRDRHRGRGAARHPRDATRARRPIEAVAATLPRLRGAFALGFLFAGEDDLLIGARHGAPLAIGYGDGRDVSRLRRPGARALHRRDHLSGGRRLGDRSRARAPTIRDDAGNAGARGRASKIAAGAFLADKGNHRHFMAKEIHEQPEVVGHTLAHYVDFAAGTRRPAGRAAVRLQGPEAALDLGLRHGLSMPGWSRKYWFESLARLPVEIDVASEFRYREAPLEPGGLALFISQSGETADTLASLRYAKAQGQHILSVVNVPTSTMARESDVVAPTLAGPEIGVASTKAFTCQLAVLLCLAIAAGRARGTL